MESICFFNGCENKSMEGSNKCTFHKNREKCRSGDCMNQVYARGLCVRHGGKKQCAFLGCLANARSGLYCCRHGKPTKKKLCLFQGCTKVAHANHRCVGHGGGRKCKEEGCTSHARLGGLCQKHRLESQTNKQTTALYSFALDYPIMKVEPTEINSWDSIMTQIDQETVNMTFDFPMKLEDFQCDFQPNDWELLMLESILSIRYVSYKCNLFYLSHV